MEAVRKLEILGAAASYDHSCTGTGFKREVPAGFEGRRKVPGIYLAHTADGRCLPLLKVLFTNKCVYDCAYCVNRRSNDIPREEFEPRELAELAFDLYKKGLVRGVFLSSGMGEHPDSTTERLLSCAEYLRNHLGFKAYLHLKVLPGTDPLLVKKALTLADRVSINLEFVRDESLRLLAPGKRQSLLVKKLRQIKELKYELGVSTSVTTQVIVGAASESDREILETAYGLYGCGLLKRMYFSAYLPANEDPRLPPPEVPPPYLRERRLYEADWLMRFYGFRPEELLSAGENLELSEDPKTVWVKRNPQFFPVELARADYYELLRVPGIGPRSAKKILELRRRGALSELSLKIAGVRLEKARGFVTLKGKLLRSPSQLKLFTFCT